MYAIFVLDFKILKWDTKESYQVADAPWTAADRISWARTVVTKSRLSFQKRKFSLILVAEETINELSNFYPLFHFSLIADLHRCSRFARPTRKWREVNSPPTSRRTPQKLKQYTYTQKTQVYFKGELRTTKAVPGAFRSHDGRKSGCSHGHRTTPHSSLIRDAVAGSERASWKKSGTR